MSCNENKMPAVEVDVADESTGKVVRAFMCCKKTSSDPGEIKDWQHMAVSLDEKMKR